MSAFLKVIDISKTYSNGNKKLKVLEDISFSIAKGEILCILGTSGCGKSTLLRMIGGFEKTDSGEILVSDKEILKPSTDMIMIFQDFNQLFPWMTVLDNVLYPLKINKMGAFDIQKIETAMEYLELVGLGDFKEYYPHQLSGGMKQRAAIARALVLRPSVILMDEPFGSLDAITRSNLQKELLAIWGKTGVTIVFVTHDITEAITLGDSIIVMDKAPGRIKEIIKNSQKRPRNMKSIDFLDLHEKIYSILDSQD